jgi:hypothetical protein
MLSSTAGLNTSIIKESSDMSWPSLSLVCNKLSHTRLLAYSLPLMPSHWKCYGPRIMHETPAPRTRYRFIGPTPQGWNCFACHGFAGASTVTLRAHAPLCSHFLARCKSMMTCCYDINRYPLARGMPPALPQKKGTTCVDNLSAVVLTS